MGGVQQKHAHREVEKLDVRPGPVKRHGSKLHAFEENLTI
jgi:hypothetical protein